MTTCIECGGLAIVYHTLPVLDRQEERRRICAACWPDHLNDQVFAQAEAIWCRWSASSEYAAQLFGGEVVLS